MAKHDHQEKMDFEKWMQKSSVTVNADAPDSAVKNALAEIGIKSDSIFDEVDELKIRLYVSELIMKREQINLDYPADYLSVVNRLLCYAEYLGCNGEIFKPVERNDKALKKEDSILERKKSINDIQEDRDKLQDSLVVAYYLSRLNMIAVNELGYKNYRAAFEGLAILMDQKPATIKNMRDEFDPYFDNGRAGWYQRSMSPSRKLVFDRMANVSDEELTSIVKEIVNQYAATEQTIEEKPSNHKRIKISSGDMKEIRAKKR